MRNNVRKKMRLICLLFAMVLLAGVPAAAKDRKNQKAAAENVVKKETIFYKGIMPSEKVLDFPVDCNTLTGSVNL